MSLDLSWPTSSILFRHSCSPLHWMRPRWPSQPVVSGYGIKPSSANVDSVRILEAPYSTSCAIVVSQYRTKDLNGDMTVFSVPLLELSLPDSGTRIPSHRSLTILMRSNSFEQALNHPLLAEMMLVLFFSLCKWLAMPCRLFRETRHIPIVGHCYWPETRHSYLV